MAPGTSRGQAEPRSAHPPCEEPCRERQKEVVGLPDPSRGRDVMPEAVPWILFEIFRHQEEGRTKEVLLLSTHTH